MPDTTSGPRRLVLVIGSSRSGTSAASAAFSMLGLHVPGPHLKANPSNPKGFYESRWSVKFHNSLLQRSRVSINDARLTAPELIAAAATPKRALRLQQWLERVTADRAQTVVKDPRAVFALSLWEQGAAATGLELGYLLMLRHPSEVVGSRATYYGGADAASSRRFATRNLAGWVAATLVAERATRGWPRALVRYEDLLRDWRATMGSVGASLALSYDVDLADAGRHPLDDFIDPGLRRHASGWDGIDAPRELIELAGEVWDGACRAQCDAAARAALDQAWDRYDAMYDSARALVQDDTAAAVDLARAQAQAGAGRPAVRARPWDRLRRSRH